MSHIAWLGPERGFKIMWNVPSQGQHSGSRGLAPASLDFDRHAPYLRIATEEAWNIPEILEAQVRLLARPGAPDDPSLRMAGMFSKLQTLQRELMDIGESRIARMDELGIDKQLLLLTAPGVQVLDPHEGTALARLANDRLAAACRRHPDRFAGLTVFAPQDVNGAVAEIERGMKTLGLNGAIINSHFRGRYLDELEYWPILEALEANDAALYIHPTIPPKAWSHPYEFRGFGGALAGFSHEVWMHVMGLIMSGAFDRFPKLRVVIGHMGEGMPLLLYRFDWMQSNADGRSGLRGGAPAVTLRRKISDYFKSNIWITTSGQAWEPSVKFCMEVLGPERVIYAMDYPYQQSADEVAAYDTFDISPQHKKMLMQTNAEHVFRLK
jgi:predicted TIM-barrel fold metal-dependent hydrolase